MEITAESRAVYRPSGKADWFRFLLGLIVAGVAAVAMAWCLFLAFRKGVL